jgi:putative two-component system response regulator
LPVKRILVVDDNPVCLRQSAAQLAGSYDVMASKEGPQALALALRRRPDLFLLDVEMPGMDGFQLLERIKEQPELTDIPAVFYSSLENTAVQVRAFKAGAKDFIIKPTAREVLVYRMELHLKRSEYLSELEDTVAALSGIMTEYFSELINFRYKMEGHSRRTPAICALLGKELLRRNTFAGELNARDVAAIVQASPLHDIGNISIPDNILLKPGPLSDAERETMKAHTFRGAGILENFARRAPAQRFLRYAKLIALSHHEAWDGSGYPMGLAGNDIPLCSRLAAVADVYDDLTSDRVYRGRMDHAAALQAVLDEAGRRFDPRITEAFAAVAEAAAETAA